jgi:hypothetical protein
MNENQDQLHASAKTAKMLCRCLAVMTLIGQLAQAASSGTGFTYQGRLFIGDVPANGLYDLQFTNYDAAAGGNALGAFNTNALPVTNGLFTVTLDFGAVFDGTPRWLEISERTNNVGAFATLAPRQLLAAAPYATYAASAGTVPGLTILQNSSGAPNVIAGSTANSVASGVFGATISGGDQNTIQDSGQYATIGGGDDNTIQTACPTTTIGGGADNTIQNFSYKATIGGGGGNTIMTNSEEATISGGDGNTINIGNTESTIGGGGGNTIQDGANDSTIGGGGGNKIQTNSTSATIGGGSGNIIQTASTTATIPGGWKNKATAYAFAAGTMAQAVNQGAFVWADSTPASFSSIANNEFAVRASGGVRFVTSGAGMTVDGNVGIGTTTPAYALDVNGDINAIGSVRAKGVALTSDRNAKENFTAVNAQQVLAKVAALPVTQWNFKTDSQDVRHLGPMAQDFQAAFGLDGADDKHISVVDEGGVALAAIQGLNQKLEETRADNADLRARLEKLERLVQSSK